MRRVLAALLLLSAALAAATGSTQSAFTATRAHGVALSAATAFPDYPTAVAGNGPLLHHRMDEAAVSGATVSAADASAHARRGVHNSATHGPTTRWTFEEASGSTVQDRSGAVNPGTLLGAAARATGKTGSGSSFTSGASTDRVQATAAAVRSDQSYTAAAWVQLSSLDANRTAFGQDAGADSAFAVEFRSGRSSPWTVRIMTATGIALHYGGTSASTGTGTWYHLALVHDAAADTFELFLDGASIITQTGFVAPVLATGPFAVGTVKSGGAYFNPWLGTVDDVLVFPRAMADEEVIGLAGGSTARSTTTRYGFSEGTGTSAANGGASTGNSATLVGGAGWCTSASPAACSPASLSLSNSTGTVAQYAETAGSGIATDQSFTVTAHARLTALSGSDYRVVVSQDSSTKANSGFFLQFKASTTNRWQFSLPTSDVSFSSGAVYDHVLSDSAPVAGTWYHLAGVYDDANNSLKLYVNGLLQSDTATHTTDFAATGRLAIGRGADGGANTGPFHGTVNRVRLYQTALSAAEVRRVRLDAELTTVSATTAYPATAQRTGALDGLEQDQAGSTAVAYNGASGGYNPTLHPSSNTVTLECWIRTTTTTGGHVLGFSSAQTGTSDASYDRLLFVDRNGRIAFGVEDGTGKRTIRSGDSQYVNDGAYHHVAASLGPAGMRLYLDGTLVATNPLVVSGSTYDGYWRWGGAKTLGYNNEPTTAMLTATLDEVAVYPSQLSDADVARHFHADH